MDGEVLQPPLLLLSELGEVSRIGEVILNPFLGPRLKSGVVTTSLPIVYDKPIDFGLQKFCGSCNKCARKCPSGAMTTGLKLMFNGYEIWKSDSQKCATYRINTAGGAIVCCRDHMIKSWTRAIVLILSTCTKFRWPNTVCGEVLSGGIRRWLRFRKCCRASLLERMSVGVIFIELQMRNTARKSRAVILH